MSDTTETAAAEPPGARARWYSEHTALFHQLRTSAGGGAVDHQRIDDGMTARVICPRTDQGAGGDGFGVRTGLGGAV